MPEGRSQIMEFLNEFFQVYWRYCLELWLPLAVGFLISGLCFQFISTEVVERHLGGRGLRPILISSVVGTALPVCCIGSLPIALTLRRKGAMLGAVLAFMVATPATSIPALIVCWKLLGLTFTVFIFFAIIVMAVIMGVVVNGINLQAKDAPNNRGQSPCCSSEASHAEGHASTTGERIKGAVAYAFVTLPREIGPEILIGIGVASFIAVFEPFQHLVREYLTGLAGYFFILIIGLATYVCSTASVPMADAFLQSGLSYGQALCYLLVGPITSYGTILVIRKDFGWRVLIVYLSIICLLSVGYGLMYDIYMS